MLWTSHNPNSVEQELQCKCEDFLNILTSVSPIIARLRAVHVRYFSIINVILSVNEREKSDIIDY